MNETYSDAYIEQVFYKWYEGNRVISPKFSNSLPPDENGNTPSFKAIDKWKDKYGWVERADALDGEVALSFQQTVIEKRVKMYEEHAEVANALIVKGKEFLANHPIEDMADALKAISLGVDIERASVGQADFGKRLVTMTDDQLTKELKKMLGQPVKADEFIDVDPIEDKPSNPEEEDA